MTIPEHILTCARKLRVTQTDAETFLWHLLRNRGFCGYKFRRQHPVGRYILDFYCHEALVAVELDGSGHAGTAQTAYDEERTRELEAAGITVVRFWNHDVLHDPLPVLEAILDVLQRKTPSAPSPGAPRHPLPEGEG